MKIPANIANMNYCDRNKTFYQVVTRLLDFDLWFLLKVRQFSKIVLKLIGPLVNFLCILALGVALLVAYTMIHVKLDVPTRCEEFERGRSKPIDDLLRLTDSSSASAMLLQRELRSLKSKALSLEMTIRKMKSQFKSLRVYTKVKDEELPDFASEAAGGSVMATPDTESYYEPRHSQATLFGIPIWSPNYFTPRKVIQPWTQAGECWALRGSRGKIEIKLAHDATIDRVTLEHIPASASLTGIINSAPREFAILGNFGDGYETIETFVYNIDGPPAQTFRITNEEMKRVPFRKVILEISSNWGHPEYTCIYRFRVHGKIYDPEDSKLRHGSSDG